MLNKIKNKINEVKIQIAIKKIETLVDELIQHPESRFIIYLKANALRSEYAKETFALRFPSRAYYQIFRVLEAKNERHFLNYYIQHRETTLN